MLGCNTVSVCVHLLLFMNEEIVERESEESGNSIKSTSYMLSNIDQ